MLNFMSMVHLPWGGGGGEGGGNAVQMLKKNLFIKTYQKLSL